jgi:uncharacterized membrane protein YgcG
VCGQVAVQVTVGVVPAAGVAPKPRVAEAPVESAPLWATLVAVTVAPVWVYVAFHMFVTCWEPDQVQVTFQDFTAVVEVLVTFTSALKPVPQSLVTV